MLRREPETLHNVEVLGNALTQWAEYEDWA
jgi:hypothetical protein